MSYQLTFGGSEAVLVRDKGTANAVQGFVSQETAVSGNTTALPTTFAFEFAQSVQLLIGTKIWLKVSSVWKETIPWIKDSGVWKQSTPYIKVGGTWK